MSNLDDRARTYFSEDEIADIKGRPVKWGSGDDADAIGLANAWWLHVEKIDRDRSLPWSDRTVWNEFDLCAAMIIRDMLERSLNNLPATLATKMVDYTAEADNRFRSMTVADSGKRMAAVAELDAAERAERGWWWFRIPDSGPILEDLARWNRFENE